MEMQKGAIYSILLLLAILQFEAARAAEYNYTFDPDSVVRVDRFAFEYAGLTEFNFNENLSVPAKTIYFGSAGFDSGNFRVKTDRAIPIRLGRVPLIDLEMRDIRTNLSADQRVFRDNEKIRLSHDSYNVTRLAYNGGEIIAVTIFPILPDQDGTIWFYDEITVETSAAPLNEFEQETAFRPANNIVLYKSDENSEAIPGCPLGIEYVIVTSPELSATWQRFADYKNALGISTAVAISDSIYTRYDGEDNAARIREYLKEFYADGGVYLLLGGDDVNLPTRYLYYYNTSVEPSDPYYLMPSDLYFADLTGVWDEDGDRIYGEPNQDQPDLVPELITGRVPLRDSAGISNYIDKLIAYETNPGNGDYDYLKKQLYFSSDQMRDYPTGGQHHYIAQANPTYVDVDTLQTVELPDGYDDNPTNPDGNYGVAKISQGFGFIQILAHGRIDGFRVKAAHYGDWPSSNILTLPIADFHGCIDDLEPNGKTSLYYALSCQVGGYDLDSTNHKSDSYSFIEGILAAEKAGAVGMVANTRWGWVYSSYFLQESFTEHLYRDAEGNAAKAMYLSWLDYPYYRDLIYGQNYYGDPSLTIYLDAPLKMTAEAIPHQDYHLLVVSDTNDTPLAGAHVNVAYKGDIIAGGYTNEAGEFTLEEELLFGEFYDIVISKEGYNVGYISYNPSLITWVDDDTNDPNESLPAAFRLYQNYPNPFNPTTVISFDLPRRSSVDIDIYNILGQEVYSEKLRNYNAGHHEYVFEGTDDDGKALPSGMYLYRITAENVTATRKMVLLK